MRIALAADESYPVLTILSEELTRRGHEVVSLGANEAQPELPWSSAAERGALSVVKGECDEAVLVCWSGTGISMAANKLPGVRAALCVDPGSAAAARVWNHANVLCLSSRLLSNDLAKEILAAWFETEPGEQGRVGVELMRELDERYRRDA